jgi:hypothetical protein
MRSRNDAARFEVARICESLQARIERIPTSRGVMKVVWPRDGFTEEFAAPLWSFTYSNLLVQLTTHSSALFGEELHHARPHPDAA